MIPLEDGRKLLKIAKDSVSAEFSGKDVDVPDSILKKYSQKQGVFVTLHKKGELRGCIGFPEPYLPLCEGIMKAAHAAAFEDPRFPPLVQNELKDVEFEISVLTVPELIKVKNPEEYLNIVCIGKDGLIIRGSFGSGLLLPQVFPEWHCNQLKALEMTCNKAGLPKDTWKELHNKIYKFQAQIFKEKRPNGEIVEEKL